MRYSHRVSLVKKDYAKFEDKISTPGEDRSKELDAGPALLGLIIVLFLCAVVW